MRLIKRLVAVALCLCFLGSYNIAIAANQGDVNGDGKILTDDAILALKYASDQKNLSVIMRVRADMDGNGTVSVKDVVEILRKCADIDPDKNLPKINHITPYSRYSSSQKVSFCEVTKDWSEATAASDTSDTHTPLYTPLQKGTFDYVSKTDSNFVYLKSGRKVDKSEAKVFSGYTMPDNKIVLQNEVKYNENSTSVYLALDWKVPFCVTLKPQSYERGYESKPYNIANDTFTAEYMDIVFYNTTGVNSIVKTFSESDVIKSSKWIVDTSAKTATLRIYLKNKGAFYGYKAYYNSNNYLVFEIKEPFSALEGKVIAVDPGHGGNQPGACAGGLRESDITYKIAVQLKRYLEAEGATVVLTHDSTTTNVPDIQQRRVWTQNTAPDMFVSVHLNSSTSTSVRGSSVFYYKNYSGPLAKCISAKLPQAVKNGINYNLQNDGFHFYPFHVTRVESCPSVLVEVGYISNSTERAMMNTVNGQKYIAKGICDGIVSYANMQ